MITNLLSFIQDCIHSATLSLKTLLYLQEANKEVMDVLVVGSGGGPDETNLSGSVFLLVPLLEWKLFLIIALECQVPC